jgi:hypothetical protein
VFACEQLSMHYERLARDFARAMEFAELGLKALQRQFGRSRDPFAAARHTRLAAKFMCRVKRLRHRIKSADSGPEAPLLAEAPATKNHGQRAR